MREGRTQRALRMIFEEAPTGRFTVTELARAIHGVEPGPTEIANMSRALRTAAPKLGLHACRVGAPETGGWRHVWGKAA